MITNRNSLSSLLIVGLTTCVLMLGVWFLLVETIENAIEKEAEAESVHWMEHFVAHLDNIETLVSRGVPDQKQSETIDIAVEDGEVFLFF